MKHFIAAVLVIASMGGCATAPKASVEQTDQAVQVSASQIASDLAILTGAEWTGDLSYLDYSNGTRESIPVSLDFDQVVDNSLLFAIKYPGETQYNSRETYNWTADGTRLNDAEILSRSELSDGEVEIVTENLGMDDNRTALIRTTYVISGTQFIVRKDVKFLDKDVFFNRNQYTLSR